MTDPYDVIVVGGKPAQFRTRGSPRNDRGSSRGQFHLDVPARIVSLCGGRAGSDFLAAENR